MTMGLKCVWYLILESRLEELGFDEFIGDHVVNGVPPLPVRDARIGALVHE